VTGEAQVIEVLGPDGFKSDAPFEIRALVDSWLADNPTASVHLEPG
jgi:hypothetical protein